MLLLINKFKVKTPINIKSILLELGNKYEDKLQTLHTHSYNPDRKEEEINLRVY